ncbi:uncharacterized protein DNG_01739 [Cephalotrichum gorgonifer]|uniref:AAA+ ATPase domain-containing protein n=1 Tax=Cephalotrichum gorgonifer TaxID=2041049 RepID=A0AAE8MT78_9PEZI|nr:uncharacterized protein DNG_01739 [Cephalotrichum gorgonifer]
MSQKAPPSLHVEDMSRHGQPGKEEAALVLEDADQTKIKKPEGDGGDQIDVANASSTSPNRSVDVNAKMEHVEDDPQELEDTLQYSHYAGFGKRLLDKERQLGNLKMRSNQAALHHAFTTIRIDDLEKELLELKNHVHGLDGDLTSLGVQKTKYPIHKHELRRSSRNDFQHTHQSIVSPVEQQPALEVLLSDAFVPRSLQITSEVTSGARAGAGDLELPNDGIPEGHQPKEVQYGTPERLRVRSRPLMSHLQKLTGNSILAYGRIDKVEEKKVYSAATFLRPFKFFVKHDAAIRKSVEELKAKIREESSQDLGSNSEAATSGKGVFRTLKPGQRDFNEKDILRDLNLLINFLDVDLKPTFDLRRRIRDGTAAEIEYADLWHLFDRGDIIVTQSNKDHAYMVVNVAGGRELLSTKILEEDKNKTFPDGLVVDCFSIGTDGSSYIPKLEKFTFRKFHGSVPISSLPAYPLRLDPSASKLRDRFLKGGRSFMEITCEPFRHKVARGVTLDEPSHDIDAQVIVDMTLALKAKPEWRLKTSISADEFSKSDGRETHDSLWCKHNSVYEGCCGSDIVFKDLELDDMDTESFVRMKGRMMGPLGKEDFKEEDLMLMRPYVHAFVLRSRQWITIRTEDLYEVIFDNSFSDLVLPDNHKTTVQALVQTHEKAKTSHPASASSNTSIGTGLDLVKGKGSGLVILLHGPPGVGKTSTAECVSDNTRRPLYPITCGDIGETAAEVESHLQYNFQLAHKWGCVLLLDEADVFLAKRTKSDLRHNAVTSVFLRSLEYYAGILFLTTNRVGAIDPAFKSRIQMALFYPALTLDVTCKLYEKFIKRAKAEQERNCSYRFKIKEKEILKFARRHFKDLEKQNYDTWNGRQIRNAFQTAIALVEHEGLTRAENDPKPVLGKAQFETVADGARKFDDYLIMTLGSTDTDAAKREGWRDDTFMAVPTSRHMAVPRGNTPSRRGYGSRTPSQAPRDSSSSSDEDSDSDDSDSDEVQSEGEKQGKSRTEKKGAATSSTEERPSNGVAGGAAPVSEMEEFQQFLSWKKAQSGR